MGLDVHAALDGKSLEHVPGGGRLADPALDAAFRSAAGAVLAQAGSRDAMLEVGGLDTHASRQALERATGMACDYGASWTPEQVREIAARAKWPAKARPGKEAVTASAKAFLETCVAHGLGIRCVG